MYHLAMSGRTGTAVVLALLIGSVPTIISLCELRCVAAEVAPPSDTAPPACAGHGADKESQPSPSGHQGCAGHVLLSKGGATGIALRLDLAVVAVPLSGSFLLALDQQPERVIPESADLSPPSGRSSDILRL